MTTKISSDNIQPGSITSASLAPGIGGGGPKISSVTVTNSSYNDLDDTALEPTGGYIKITGSGFAAGCQVLINTTPVTSVTFVSTAEVRCQVPATAVGTYTLYLVNSDGGTAIRVNGVTFSGTPIWITSSTLPPKATDQSFSVQLSATGAASYQLQSGSSLPAGLTLSSTGLLSGAVTVTNDTSYNFVIEAVDAELQSSARSFSLEIKLTLEIPLEMLLVAGGGGGGSTNSGDGGGGGGGAGGLLYYGTETPKTPNGSVVLVNPETSYSITIGTGGAGGASGSMGSNGTNTVFSGGGLSYTAIGGGRGGAWPGANNQSLYGGSGGGMYSGVTAAEPGQGYVGGNSNGAGCYSGGGGGGAGGSGQVPTNSGGSCTGGPGLTYSIVGTPTAYAGGGGGHGRCGGYSGGVGGGGNGGSSGGTPNTGGGGGGNSGSTGDRGFSGGSGVVVIAYPNTYPAISSIAPGLTYDQPTRAGYRVYRFTAGSGNIIF